MNKFKVNQNKNKSIEQIANILNGQMLLDINCSSKGNGFTLRIETFGTVLEYLETSRTEMIKFLNSLKEKLIIKDDIETILNNIN
jgi:hypothetical protein